MLMCKREESRPMESIARFFVKPIQWISPTLMTTPVEILAKAMINNTLLPTKPQNEVIENVKIFQLADATK